MEVPKDKGYDFNYTYLDNDQPSNQHRHLELVGGDKVEMWFLERRFIYQADTDFDENIHI